MTEHMYNPGDAVLVKEDAAKIKPKNGDVISFDMRGKMREYLGREMVIKTFRPSMSGLPRYTLENCSGENYDWIWAEEWLDSAAKIENVSETDMMNVFE